MRFKIDAVFLDLLCDSNLTQSSLKHYEFQKLHMDLWIVMGFERYTGLVMRFGRYADVLQFL